MTQPQAACSKAAIGQKWTFGNLNAESHLSNFYLKAVTSL